MSFQVLDAPEEEQGPETLRFVTQVTLTLTGHDLYTEGLGQAVEKFNANGKYYNLKLLIPCFFPQ